MLKYAGIQLIGHFHSGIGRQELAGTLFYFWQLLRITIDRAGTGINKAFAATQATGFKHQRISKYVDANGFDRLTVSSLDISGSLSLVDRLEETVNIGSLLDLSTIYLNPLDSLGEIPLSFSGLVLGNQGDLVLGNEGVDEMFQALSSLDLFF